MREQLDYLSRHFASCILYGECPDCDRFFEARRVLLEVPFPQEELHTVHQVFRVAGRR